jgi:hypothetical protein
MVRLLQLSRVVIRSSEGWLAGPLRRAILIVYALRALYTLEQGIALLRLNSIPMQASVKNIDDTSLAIEQFQVIRLFRDFLGFTYARDFYVPTVPVEKNLFLDSRVRFSAFTTRNRYSNSGLFCTDQESYYKKNQQPTTS